MSMIVPTWCLRAAKVSDYQLMMRDGHSPKGLPGLVTDLLILLQVTKLSLTTADSRRRTCRQKKGFPLGLLHLDHLRVQSRFMMGNAFPAEA